MARHAVALTLGAFAAFGCDASGGGDLGAPTIDLRREAHDLVALDAGSSRDLEKVFDAASAPDVAISDSATGDSATNDLAMSDLATGGDAGAGNFRTSLASCLATDCPRAMIVAHGGEWAIPNPPYGTKTALEKAYSNGADAIKVDVRFSKDGVPVLVHDSPFALQDLSPLDIFSCSGSVEDMNVADIVKCHWLNGDAIQRLDEVLGWAKGKMLVMLTPKTNPTNKAPAASVIPKTIAAVNQLAANDVAFIEVGLGDFQAIVPMAPGANQVDYVVAVGNPTDVTTLLGLKNPRVIVVEDSSSGNFGGLANDAVTQLINTQIHPAGPRAMADLVGSQNQFATEQNHKDLFDRGYDVIMTNSASPGIQARIAENTARGLSPP